MGERNIILRKKYVYLLCVCTDCLQVFLDHCEDFVRQLDSVSDINLFLTELK